MDEIRLGLKVRDKVTGFEGIATAKCEYINGCIQYGVTPKIGEDGKYPDCQYLDYKRLEIVGDGVNIDFEDTGGPMIDAPH